MPTFTQLPSKKWRVQVRKAGLYRAATFELKRDAVAWATQVEAQATHTAASGFAPIPKGATVGDLIDKYIEDQAASGVVYGRTKTSTLAMLKREIGNVKLANLNAVILRDLIDRRKVTVAPGRDKPTGGVTLSADMSYLSAVLKWARHSRKLDVNERLGLEAIQGIKAGGTNTRAVERDREPTDDELDRLYTSWNSRPVRKIPMVLMCKFALATGMRQGEITRLEIDDIDRAARTVIIRDRKDPKKKLGNNQTVPLLPDAWALVQPLIDGRETGFLFPYNAESISAAFTRECKALGIKDLHFHDLRHRAAASFFRMGLNIPQVSILTGHKTWSMLRRYTDIKPADVHEAIRKASENTPVLVK
jgi:integrase